MYSRRSVIWTNVDLDYNLTKNSDNRETQRHHKLKKEHKYQKSLIIIEVVHKN